MSQNQEPSVFLDNKTIYSKCTRHQSECYNPVLNQRTGSRQSAYLRVDGNRESLVYQATPDADEELLTTGTYVLSPCFAGPYLFWVEQVDKSWEIRAADLEAEPETTVSSPIKTAGRPIHLAAWQSEQTSVLVWEERDGKRTQVKLCVITENRIGSPITVTDPSCNAYDPAVCMTAKGTIAVAFCVFRNGHYRVELQELSMGGNKLDGPYPLSHCPDACLYPSIWPDQRGGIWFSFTGFTQMSQGLQTLVNHFRFRSMKACFNRSTTLFAGYLAPDRQLFAPWAPENPGNKQGHNTAMVVHPAANAGRSRIFTDSLGNVRLLVRQSKVRDADSFATEANPFPVYPKRNPDASHIYYPNLSLVSLLDGYWSSPVCLVADACFDGPIDFNIDGNNVTVVFCENTRKTGWSGSGEWFDSEGQMGIGIAQLRSLAQAPISYELRRYAIPPVQATGIENPAVPATTHLGHQLVIGQTHTHSDISLCIRSADRDIHFNYRFMQDVQHSDFGATTDHAYNMWHTEMLRTRKLAEYYYFPGQFVAFPAYEWTGSIVSHDGGPWGHVNPLYLEEDGDLDFLTPCDPQCAGGTLPKLWETYHGLRIITPPHHTADNLHTFNWEFYDPEFLPVVEIFQDSRGSGEQPDVAGMTNSAHSEHGWILPELKRGRRIGFIASGDHCGIARAGLWVKELTRNGLYEAFMARRTFATTQQEMAIHFDCNGYPMGTEVTCDKAAFDLQIHSPLPIHEIQVVRNGDTVEVKPGSGRELTHQWTQDAFEDGEFWYCRIILKNGEMAWTSPIWLLPEG